MSAETQAPAIIHNAREAWLLRRRGLVTASDAAAIMGLDPYRKPGDVYAAKLGLVDDEESWPMVYGTAFQDGVGRAYARHTGRPVAMASLELPEITIHPALPWLGATLDGDVEGSDRKPAPADGRGVLETKVSSLAHTWPDDELPVHFQIQVTVQAACSRRLWGAIAAFVSLRQPPREQDVVFDEELFKLMVPKLEEFQWRVQTKTPPLDTPEWFSHAAIRKIWSKNSGESIALTTEEDLGLVKAWLEAKAKKKAAEEEEEALGDRLRLRLNGAALAYVPDGGAVALSNVKETVVERHTKAAHTRLLWKQPKRGR